MQDYAEWFSAHDRLLAWIFSIYGLRGAEGQSWLTLAAEPHPSELNDLKRRAAEGSPGGT